jgi:hypothetical protein
VDGDGGADKGDELAKEDADGDVDDKEKPRSLDEKVQDEKLLSPPAPSPAPASGYPTLATEHAPGTRRNATKPAHADRYLRDFLKSVHRHKKGQGNSTLTARHREHMGALSDASIPEHYVPRVTGPLALPGVVPPHLIWGAGSAAQLIEGSADGSRGLTIWDWHLRREAGRRMGVPDVTIYVGEEEESGRNAGDKDTIVPYADAAKNANTTRPLTTTSTHADPASPTAATSDPAWGPTRAAPPTPVTDGHGSARLNTTPSSRPLRPLTIPGLSPTGSAIDFAAFSSSLYFEDVRAAKHLGVDVYAFSIAWARLMNADGTPNPEGVAYYDTLVDSLLRAGVAPVATLYHWDLPIWLDGEENSEGMNVYR